MNQKSVRIKQISLSYKLSNAWGGAMILIRPESSEHFEAIRTVLTEAFGRAWEAELVDALRGQKGCLFALTALEDGKVVGHLAVVPVVLVTPDGKEHAAAGLGPLGVLPAQRGRGTGSRLVNAALEECRQQGHPVVFAVGGVDFYGRYGFGPASRYELREETDLPGDLLAFEVRRGALDGKRGVVRFPSEFQV
jgi:putative acetyltransferase